MNSCWAKAYEKPKSPCKPAYSQPLLVDGGVETRLSLEEFYQSDKIMNAL